MNAPASKAKIDPKPLISQAARDALDKAGGDIAAAVDVMHRTMRSDRALYAAVMEPLERSACYEAIASIIRQSRAKVWQAPNAAADTGGRILALVRHLMDFPLPGGKRLADATKVDLVAAAEFYSKQAGDMAHKSRWLAAVAGKLGDSDVVRTTLDEAALAALQKETEDA